MENQKKNQFRQIYDALPPRAVAAPKARWVERMAEVAMVSTKTVRCWLAGVQKPDAIKQRHSQMNWEYQQINYSFNQMQVRL